MVILTTSWFANFHNHYALYVFHCHKMGWWLTLLHNFKIDLEHLDTVCLVYILISLSVLLLCVDLSVGTPGAVTLMLSFLSPPLDWQWAAWHSFCHAIKLLLWRLVSRGEAVGLQWNRMWWQHLAACWPQYLTVLASPLEKNWSQCCPVEWSHLIGVPEQASFMIWLADHIPLALWHTSWCPRYMSMVAIL